MALPSFYSQTPANAEIFGAPYASPGVPNVSGYGGPNLPGVSWEPRGANTRQTDPAPYLRYGQAPSSHGHVQIRGLDFIQATYLAPPWGDGESEKYIARDMLVFAVNQMDPDENTTVILTISKLNQLAHDAWVDFKSFSNPTDPDYFEQAGIFKNYLERFGEKCLEDYHYARKHSPNGLLKKMQEDMDAANGSFADLEDFYRMATMDVFCWLTKFGIVQKVSFLGTVINVTGGVGDDEMYADRLANISHYMQVNVCLAKRGRVANIFGTADNVTTGSKVWLNLRRRPVQTNRGIEYREFQVVPVGTRLEDYPSRTSVYYMDASGRPMFGHTWRVGTVIQPGAFSPQTATVKRAANISSVCNERLAYEEHAALPVLYVALGVK